jgi:hypothetical protein
MRLSIKFLFSLLICFAYLSICGQSSLGVKFGTNFSQVAGQDIYYNTTWLNGLQGGVSFSFGLGNTLGLQSDVMLVQKGGKMDFGLYGVPVDHVTGTYRVNYIEIPVVLTRKFYLQERLVRLGLGGFVGVGVSGFADYEFVRNDPTNPVNNGVVHEKKVDMIFFKSLAGDFGTDFIENRFGATRKIDAGLRLLASYEFPVARVELAYSHGMINTGEDKAFWHYPGYTTELRSRSIQLSIVYLLVH